ncbi:hypothetical protein AC1031_003502 [Aphanomyces cochlioides]|nr:hypothetical protein AC1031_003502 [Aphanomyces cochlioides]
MDFTKTPATIHSTATVDCTDTNTAMGCALVAPLDASCAPFVVAPLATTMGATQASPLAALITPRHGTSRASAVRFAQALRLCSICTPLDATALGSSMKRAETAALGASRAAEDLALVDSAMAGAKAIEASFSETRLNAAHHCRVCRGVNVRLGDEALRVGAGRRGIEEERSKLINTQRAVKVFRGCLPFLGLVDNIHPFLEVVDDGADITVYRECGGGVMKARGHRQAKANPRMPQPSAPAIDPRMDLPTVPDCATCRDKVATKKLYSWT